MLNKVVIMGRLTADPKLSKTNGGISVCTFNIACDRDRGEECDFFPVVAWRGAAEWAERYLEKGKQIAVEGRLVTRKWTDKEGNNHKETEINAEQLYFAG